MNHSRSLWQEPLPEFSRLSRLRTGSGPNWEPFFPVFGVSRDTVIMQLAAALLVGAVAALFPGLRAAQLRIVDGLRNIG